MPTDPEGEGDICVVLPGSAIHRQGGELSNSRMYITKGERIKGGCRWQTKSIGSDDRTIVSREVATNLGTCESLIEEGSPVG